MKIVLIAFISFFLYQCGLPNPYSFGNNANPPFKIESHSINNNIYMKVTSYNQSEIRELIHGYNVFFAFSTNVSSIQSNIIYLNTIGGLPSIKESPTQDNYSFDVNLLGNFSYGQIESSTKTNIINNYQITPFTSYYFIITPVSKMEDLSNDKFFLIHKETTEYNEMNKTLTIPSSITHLSANVSFSHSGSDNLIIGNNGNEIQDLGFYSDFNQINQAPNSGYANYPLILKKNHIYVYKTNTNKYGKIFVRNISSTHVTLDFSYQDKKEEHEI